MTLPGQLGLFSLDDGVLEIARGTAMRLDGAIALDALRQRIERIGRAGGGTCTERYGAAAPSPHP